MGAEMAMPIWDIGDFQARSSSPAALEMSSMKKVCLVVSLILLAVGLAIFLWDACTSHRYGFHMNEVAGLTEAGEPIDWPTGERPLLMEIPISVYALAFCLAPMAIYALRLRSGRTFQGRICRGTE